MADLLELESGSNDPMAVFLTVGLIEIMRSPQSSAGSEAEFFIVQMGVGAAFGIASGKGMVWLLNRLKLSHEGIYPVFALAFAGLVYGN